MALLPPIEIESELSYAYLHAVAAHAGMSCECTNRHVDKMGIDAMVRACELFAHDSVLTDIALDVQLKATVLTPVKADGNLSYFLHGVGRYDKLRKTTTNIPRIVIVLFLPKEHSEWLTHTDEQLAIKKCAWWVSLLNAPAMDNKSGTTIYLPEVQIFNPSSLREIMTRLSKQESLVYAG